MAKPPPDPLARAEARQAGAAAALEAALIRQDRLGIFEGQLAVAAAAIDLSVAGPPLTDADKAQLTDVRGHFMARIVDIDAARNRRPEDFVRWRNVRAGFVRAVRWIEAQTGAKPWDGVTRPRKSPRYTPSSDPNRDRENLERAIRLLREL